MAYISSLSAIQFKNKIDVSGVLLKRAPFKIYKSTGWLENAWLIISSYFNTALPNKEIAITVDNSTIKTITDKKGNFSVSLDSIIEEEIIICLVGKKDKLPIHQNYPIFFKENPSKLIVISDIDETILVSHTKTMVKRFFITLFRTASQRKVIPFTEQLYNFLNKENPNFFYVSKSEFNLSPIIAYFIKYNKLPEGPLLLTSYLNFLGLISTKKDKDFKLNKIKYLIKNSFEKKLILIGDDSQRDMQIYTVIAKEYKSLISSVYIRRTNKFTSKIQEENWLALKATGVPSYYFENDESFINYYKNQKNY